MAKPHKKKKYIKATPPINKESIYNAPKIDDAAKYLDDQIDKFSKLMLEQQKAAETVAMVKPLDYSQQGIISPSDYAQAKTDFFKQLYGGYDKGTWTKKPSWDTWIRQQMFKLDPRVKEVKVFKTDIDFSIHFGVVLDVGTDTKAYIEHTVSDELLAQYGTLTENWLTDAILVTLDKKIKESYPLGSPGNMTVVSNPYIDKDSAFILGPNATAAFNDAKIAWDKVIASSNFGKELAKPKPVPVPPDEDKKYHVSASDAFNNALEATTKHLKKMQSTSHAWGDIEADIIKHINEAKLAYQKQQSKYPGFSGSVVQDSLRNVLPCLYEQVKCPKCGRKDAMSDMIIHLNDQEMWSREQIADWAESLDIDISVRETK